MPRRAFNLQYIYRMNRGFLYGDGFFETIRTVNGSVPLLPFHLKRIKKALEIYQLEPEAVLSEEWLESLIDKDKNPNHLIRISFYRDGVGSYLPMNNYFKTHIRLSDATQTFWLPAEHDLSADIVNAPNSGGNILIYPDPKPIHSTLTVKSLSSAYYVLAAKYMADKSADHLILTNEAGHLLEELRSNIYLEIDGSIFLPPQDSGQVIGASEMYMRLYFGPQMTEKILTADDLKRANAIYCSRGSIGLIRIK